MFAVLHLPQFALQAALRHQPELWARPVALVDPALPTPRVCAVTAPARALAVVEGLTPTQALARCRDVLIRHRSPAQEAAATDAILQCAFGFSPNIEHTAPDTVTLDLHGLSELNVGRASSLSTTADTRPVSNSTLNAIQASQSIITRVARDRLEACPTLIAWAARLRAALAALNLTARIGLGPTPNVARHAAWWGVDLSLQACVTPSPTLGERDGVRGNAIVVLDSPTFIASLPVAALDPSTDIADILRKWGVRTVGELLALEQEAVVDRLGLEALALFAAASTSATRPLNLVQPAERYEESFDFEQSIETAETLLFLLNRFVAQLCHRLDPAGLAVGLLTLRLRLESGESLERGLRVPAPTRRADVLFRMLQMHLELLRTDSPIVGVALQADPVQPEQKQFSLFEAALRDPHQLQETLARLSALVGADRVGTPVRENSHRPDAFKLVPPDFENAPETLRPRVPEILRTAPMRKLRPPVKAKVEMGENSKLKAQSSREVPGSKHPARHHAVGERSNIVDLLGPLFSAPRGFGVRQSSGALDDSALSHEGERRHGTAALHDAVVPSSHSVDAPSPASTLQPVAPSTSSPPVALQCMVAKGKLTVALGPWRASGRWWEPGAWQREEWDVQTRDGQALRLVNEAGEWRVDAVAD